MPSKKLQAFGDLIKKYFITFKEHTVAMEMLDHKQNKLVINTIEYLTV